MSEIVYLVPKAATYVREPNREGALALFVDESGVLQVMDQHRRVRALSTLRSTIGKYNISIATQGTTGTPSVIKIEADDLAGNDLGICPSNSSLSLDNADDLLRVWVCNDGTHADSTNATIAVSNGSALEWALTATKDIVIRPANAAFATLSTALSGSDNDLDWTAVTSGSTGNSITIAYVNPATPSAALSIGVSGSAITVNLATDAGTPQVETAVVVSTTTGSAQVDRIRVTAEDANTTLHEKGFILTDDVGTVGVWFDVGGGGAAPSDITACARTLEITGITAAMTAAQVATQLATELHADAKFNAAVLNDVFDDIIEVTHSTVGLKTIPVDPATGGQAAQFDYSIYTAGVATQTGPTEDGSLPITFTAAAVTGTPVTVYAALLNTDADADAVATKIRAALTANAAIAAIYTIGGSGANVVATKTIAAANDATLNIAWTSVVAGVSAVTSSTNTTAGVVPAITSTGDLIKTAIGNSAAASALVTVADKAANDGSGVVIAMGATALSGGGTGAEDEFYVALTNATAEVTSLRCGLSPFGSKMVALLDESIDVEHEAP